MFEKLRRLYLELRVFTRGDVELGRMLVETIVEEGVIWCVGYETAVIATRLRDGFRAGIEFCEGETDGAE